MTRSSNTEPSILVIDDERDLVDVITGLLNHAGLAARGTTDPDEAVRLVTQNDAIKLILADVRMPIMTGPEVIRLALRSRSDEVRVAFMSGTQTHFYFRRTDLFLGKPLQFDVLVTALRQALTEKPKTLPWTGHERRRHALQR